MRHPAYVGELAEIKERAGGTLRPEDVVAFAASPNTVLHNHFTWDDGEAAHLYRLEEARRLIRAVVTIVPTKDGGEIQVRAFVSLPSDRGSVGYRAVEEVMSDEQRAAEAMASLRADVNRLERKYLAFAAVRPILVKMKAALDAA